MKKPNFFFKLVRFFSRLPVVVRAINKIYYPKIHIGNNTNFSINGTFKYGSNSSIADGVNLTLPEHCELILGNNCNIGRHVELGPAKKIEIGSNTSVQDRCILLGDVLVGRYCLFAPNIYISSGKHYFDLFPTWLIRDQDKFVLNDEEKSSNHSKCVVIEDDCWLGINVVIMSGITIGKGAVIGANSVVTKDIKPYTIVAGAPAKLINKRLHFVPPNSISYINSNYLPYFYSGFEVSQRSLKKNAYHLGIVTLRKFVICLNAINGRSIHLIIKTLASTSSTLIYQGEELSVSNSMQEISFQINGSKNTMFHFVAGQNTENAQFVVQKAWIQ